MEFTQNTGDYLHTRATGYMVNTVLSEDTQRKIAYIQDVLQKQFPNALWSTPSDTLHITLLDWLAPLVDYSKNKDVLYEELFAEYDAAMNQALAGRMAIDIQFHTLLVSPTAIAIVADLASTQIFNDIRNNFLHCVDLLPATKQPPTIVHSTIARFIGAIAMDDVRTFAQSLSLSLPETIQEFQLIRETTLPMLDYSVIKKYSLINE